MLDFFTIFSKGGIVLWCFQGAGVTESFAGPVNALIRSVILQVSLDAATKLSRKFSSACAISVSFRANAKRVAYVVSERPLV